MSAMLLVVTVAGRRAALPAERVNSVVEPASVVPVPRAPVHVAGLAALRSRPLTIIDCQAALGFGLAPSQDGIARAVVVEHEGHLYGLAVDAADDIVPALSEPNVPADPGPGWNSASLGVVESPLGPLLVLDIGRLVAGTAALDV
ncbi:MAG: chemotaxis protein CheW [Croceibacterium sp.]